MGCVISWIKARHRPDPGFTAANRQQPFFSAAVPVQYPTPEPYDIRAAARRFDEMHRGPLAGSDFVSELPAPPGHDSGTVQGASSTPSGIRRKKMSSEQVERAMAIIAGATVGGAK